MITVTGGAPRSTYNTWRRQHRQPCGSCGRRWLLGCWAGGLQGLWDKVWVQGRAHGMGGRWSTAPPELWEFSALGSRGWFAVLAPPFPAGSGMLAWLFFLRLTLRFGAAPQLGRSSRAPGTGCRTFPTARFPPRSSRPRVPARPTRSGIRDSLRLPKCLPTQSKSHKLLFTFNCCFNAANYN